MNETHNWDIRCSVESNAPEIMPSWDAFREAWKDEERTSSQQLCLEKHFPIR